jgi:hypothetical protein
MKSVRKEFNFLFAWIVLIAFGTLVLGRYPILEKSLYLSAAIIGELWIVFRLPGAKLLWIFSKNANSSKYREIRIISALFIWFFMLAIPKGFDLFVYYAFVLCIERVIFFCASQKKEKLLQKLFPSYKEYGILSILAFSAGFLLILFLSFEIGTKIAQQFV